MGWFLRNKPVVPKTETPERVIKRPRFPPPPPPPAGKKVSSEIDELKERVNELERKVRDLDWLKKVLQAGDDK